MGFFSNLFNKSSFFSSEYTDKTMMSLTEVMNAHANWKARLNKFMEGTLGYNLDPEMLAQANDTELGRWILQSDEMPMDDERRNLLQQLHQANVELHIAASAIAQYVLDGDKEIVAVMDRKFQAASKQVMLLLRMLAKES